MDGMRVVIVKETKVYLEPRKRSTFQFHPDTFPCLFKEKHLPVD